MSGERPPVREDPELPTEEKRTDIRVPKRGDRFFITTTVATIARWLVLHPEYEEKSRRVVDGALYETTGTLPIGALSLLAESRKSNHISQVPEELPEEAV